MPDSFDKPGVHKAEIVVTLIPEDSPNEGYYMGATPSVISAFGVRVPYPKKYLEAEFNVRNTDMVVAVDDEHTVRLLRLFNEPVGRSYLQKMKVPTQIAESLESLGISSIGNLVGAIKFAKYYELTENDIVLTVFTDSLELYGSRLDELREERGDYIEEDAIRDYELLNNIFIVLFLFRVLINFIKDVSSGGRGVKR